MKRARRFTLGALAVLAALPGPGAPAVAGEVRRVEAVGAVALTADALQPVPPRDAALRAALSDAVRRVALEFLPEVDPAAFETTLGEVLGDEPLDYVTRYQILEDRGERPALFIEDPDVETEYVVVVEVHVDTDRVREQLARSGLLAMPSGGARRPPVQVVIRDLRGYQEYAAVRRTLLDEVGARSVLPLEMERGRIVLEVDADREPADLLDALRSAAPPELRVTPLGAEDDTLTLRVELEAPPVVSGPGAAGPAGD